jgi:hypothetical protein
MRDIDYSLDGAYTNAHLARFHTYADAVRDDTTDKLLPKPDFKQYNIWVYDLRQAYGNHRELPRFSPDYDGDVPRQPVTANSSTKGRTTHGEVPANSTGQSFAEQFALHLMPVVSQATLAMIDQGRAASRITSNNAKRGGKHGNFFGARPSYKVDTYYGKGSEYGGSTSGKRGRTISPEERHTRARRDSRSPSRSEVPDHYRSSSSSTFRSPSPEPGDRTPRGRRVTRSPEPIRRRPDSRTEEEAAKRSRERLGRELDIFQKQRLREIDARQRKEAEDAHAAAKSASVTVHSEDVEMTPAPAGDLIDLATPETAPKDKGKGKEKAVDLEEGAGTSGGLDAPESDLDFFDTLWAMDENGNILPPLPKAGTDEF